MFTSSALTLIRWRVARVLCVRACARARVHIHNIRCTHVRRACVYMSIYTMYICTTYAVRRTAYTCTYNVRRTQKRTSVRRVCVQLCVSTLHVVHCTPVYAYCTSESAYAYMRRVCERATYVQCTLYMHTVHMWYILRAHMRMYNVH